MASSGEQGRTMLSPFPYFPPLLRAFREHDCASLTENAQRCWRPAVFRSAAPAASLSCVQYCTAHCAVWLASVFANLPATAVVRIPWPQGSAEHVAQLNNAQLALAFSTVCAE